MTTGRPTLRVAVLVDSEYLRRTLLVYFGTTEIQPVLTEIHKVASEIGNATIRNAYGDWSANPAHSRIYQGSGFQPIMVPRKDSGPDRSDMEMALDAFALLSAQSEVDAFMFVSGDADFQAVIRRIRARAKRAIVAAFSVNVARDLLSEVDQAFAIDARLGMSQLAVRHDLPAEVDVERVILALDDLESRLELVHYRYFRDRVLDSAMGAGGNEDARNAILISLERAGIVDVGKSPNKEGTAEISTLKLVRSHPIVTAALRSKSGVPG